MIDKKDLMKYNKTQEKLIDNIIYYNFCSPSVFHEKLLVSLEKEVVCLRQLISMCPDQHKKHWNFPANSYEISIKSEQSNGHIRYVLDLPFLLPNRRSPKTNFKRTIANDVHSCILDFCEKENPKMINNASVTFINYYAPSVNRKLRHDNDNSELSSILNALTGFLIPDDNSLCCDLHIISREADKSFTRVIVEKRLIEND